MDVPDKAPPGDPIRREDTGPGTVLCALGDIPDPGALTFEVGRRPRFFVVRAGGALRGYVDVCPHQGLSLHWRPHRYLTHDGAYIICANHAALFAIGDGACVSGPCARQGLKPVALREDDGKVLLDE